MSKNKNILSEINLERPKVDNIDIDESDLEDQEIKLKNLEYKTTIKMRIEYADKIFYFISCWSFLIFVILFLQGFKFFYLTDIVITTLITTSFIQVLGLMYIVLHHIFPKK